MPFATETQPGIAATPITTADSRGRIASVDALRGFDMFWIIGADALFYALNKLAGGDGASLIGFFATQLDHVQWAGFRFYDLIFPLFVFIVGVSIVFALTKRVAEQGRAAATSQILRRALILYLFGIFSYEGVAKGWEGVRLLGVLQRIAICYLITGFAFIYLKPKTLVALCSSLLIGYWALMTFVPVPDVGAGNFAEGKNLANYIDKQYLPLFKWDGDHDPEGLLSTLPAIASCLLGVFAGLWLRRTDIDDRRKVKMLCALGAVGVVVGFLWGLQFPIVKKLWTSSFVLVAGGFSAILLGLFYFVIDIKKKDWWATPFMWIGTNAITIYMLVHIVDLPKLAERIAGGPIKAWFDAIRPGFGELLIALVALAAAVLFCRFLYRRRIFLKV